MSQTVSVASLALDVLFSEARQDFSLFLRCLYPPSSGYTLGKMHLYLAGLFHASMKGDGPRNRCISVAPQSGKSSLMIRLVAWVVGAFPGIQVAITGFSSSLLVEFLDRISEITRQAGYNRIFPQVVIEGGADRQNYKRFSNGSSIVVKPAGSKLTGRRVDLLIVDDAHAGREEAESPTQRRKVLQWFMADCLTRLSPQANVFIIGTRWHPEDLIGSVTGEEYVSSLSAEGQTEAIFDVVKLKAICEDEDDPLGRAMGEALFPEGRPLEFLLRQKAMLPAYEWDSQFRQEPATSGGGQIDLAKLIRIDSKDLPHGLTVASGWDLAVSESSVADYTAGACCGRDKEGNMYVIDINRQKLGITKCIPNITQRALSWRSTLHALTLGIEGVGGFRAYYDLVKKELSGSVSVKLKNPKQGGKLLRARPWFNMIEGGKVYLVRGAWNKEFLEELRLFPNGTHDDQIDAVSIAYETLFQTSHLWLG